MKNSIKNKEALALYKELLNEKLGLKEQKLAFHTQELKSKLKITSLFSHTNFGQEFKELKILSVVEAANIIYKTTTGKKQTPYLVRLARILIPKFLALRKP